MSKVIKILLKNVVVISFSIVIVMTAVLSALVTRYFDRKECNNKVDICEVNYNKKINNQNNQSEKEDVNLDKRASTSNIVPKDIVVSVEIMKSENKQSINNGDNKQRNRKTAQKYDNKKKQKKTSINNNEETAAKEKKDDRDLKGQKKDSDGSNVIRIINNNNVILSGDDENDIGNVSKETLVSGGDGEGNVLVIDGSSKTNVKENLVDLQKNEHAKNSEKNDFVSSELKDKESKENGKVVNESTIVINDVKNLDTEKENDTEKEKNNPSVDNKSKLKKESSEVHNTIILIDE